MRTFIKVQLASIAGSLVDYILTILLVQLGMWNYLPANAIGNLCGGSLQFVLCRNWAFRADRGKTKNQVMRFMAVFAGNLILSELGVWFFTGFIHFQYLVSKTLVSVILGVSYNYLLQKKFVFDAGPATGKK